MRARRLNFPCSLLLTALTFATVGLSGPVHTLSRPAEAEPSRDAVGRNGMVVTRSAPASDVGLSILKEGGNAVDAAVATALALAVTYPAAGNIGGGGFMLIYPADGRPVVMVDYREKAPASSTPSMFAERTNRLGHKIVGVPGTVGGLVLAHERYGKLPWRKLVDPAVRLASEGFVIDGSLARSLNRVLKRTKGFQEFVRVFGKRGGTEVWHAGERLVQKDLGRTLQRIADQGTSGFYEGETAELIVKEMAQGGGLITKRDLLDYQAKVRKPIHTTFRGYDVYGPAPPSSGGICLAQILNVLEHFDLKKKGRWSPDTVHLIIEAMRRAYCDRAKYLGDADFVDIPAHLVTKEYARSLAQQIDPKRATPSEALAPPIELAAEGTETTHFSVMDSSGMAVSNTFTLEKGYGSRVVVSGAGFLLNNEMKDFNWRPGVTDRRGRIGTAANQIEPGKRMLSSMTPVIVVRDGHVVLVTGSPGGRTIINTVLCVTLNVLEFGMDIRQALDAPRLDHKWFPNRVKFGGADEAAYAPLVASLRRMGHDIRAGRQGDANSILVTNGRLHGAADSRFGKASGF